MFAGFSYVSVVSARAWLLPPLPSRGGSTFQAVQLLNGLGAEGYKKNGKALNVRVCVFDVISTLTFCQIVYLC